MSFPIEGSIKVECADSCNCDCFPWSNPHMYINSYGQAERFDSKKAQGDENKQSIQRLQERIKVILHTKNAQIDTLKKRIEVLSGLNLELMERLDIKLTKKRLDRINDAVRRTLREAI